MVWSRAARTATIDNRRSDSMKHTLTLPSQKRFIKQLLPTPPSPMEMTLMRTSSGSGAGALLSDIVAGRATSVQDKCLAPAAATSTTRDHRAGSGQLEVGQSYSEHRLVLGTVHTYLSLV